MGKRKQPRAYAAVTMRFYRPEMTVCLTRHLPPALRDSFTTDRDHARWPCPADSSGYLNLNVACATRLRSYRSAAADALALGIVHQMVHNEVKGGAARPRRTP